MATTPTIARRAEIASELVTAIETYLDRMYEVELRGQRLVAAAAGQGAEIELIVGSQNLRSIPEALFRLWSSYRLSIAAAALSALYEEIIIAAEDGEDLVVAKQPELIAGAVWRIIGETAEQARRDQGL